MATAISIGRTPEALALLKQTVERALSRSWGTPVTLSTLSLEPSPFASRVPVEIVRARTDAGESIALFLKSTGDEEADHPDKQVRDREAWIYQSLIRDPELPVPEFYGATWNEISGRRELILEFIDDWDLRYQALETWYIAAACLADLHRHFAERLESLAAADHLLQLNSAYFQQWSLRALQATAEQSEALGERLGTLLTRYDAVARLLDTQPRTLVHNDLAAKNILADRSSSPARIAIVDWEMAGVGCGLLDLVTFKYGLDPASEQRLIDAYFSQLRGSSLNIVPTEDLHRVLAACEAHKAMTRLWRNRVWRLPEEKVARWIDEIEMHLATVAGGP